MTDPGKSLVEELAALEHLRDPSKSKGLRQYRRFVIRGDAELLPMDPTELVRAPIDITLRDISRGGVGFVCSTELPLRSVWRMVLNTHGYAVGMMALVIRHRRVVRDGVILTGGQFGIPTGLMITTGVDPAAISRTDSDPDADLDTGDDGTFVDPQGVC